MTRWERFLAWLRNEHQHHYTHPSLRKSVIVTRPAPLSRKAYLGPPRKRKVKIPKRHRKPVAPVPGN